MKASIEQTTTLNSSFKEPLPRMQQTRKNLLESNRKNIVEIRCKKCHLKHEQGHRKCIQCGSNLEWLCKCGVRRSYSNLSIHDCDKTRKRRMLKEKFKQKKMQIIKTIMEQTKKETTNNDKFLIQNLFKSS
jgi:hypothetical protein